MKKTVLISLTALLLVGCRWRSGKGERQIEFLRVTFINVGKADSIVIQLEDQNYLIDTGSAKSTEQLDEALNQLGVNRLAAVFLTHAHKDHIGGFDYLSKNYQIDKVYISGLGEISDNDVIYQAKGRNIPVEILAHQTTLQLTPSLTMKVLGPQHEFEDENNNSMVFLLNYYSRKILLAADMLLDAETELLGINQDISADILKVAHHGQDDSSSAEFIDRIKPSYCIISTDTKEREKSADPELIKRLGGCEVYITEDYEKGILLMLDNFGEIYSGKLGK